MHFRATSEMIMKTCEGHTAPPLKCGAMESRVAYRIYTQALSLLADVAALASNRPPSLAASAAAELDSIVSNDCVPHNEPP